jgi:haloalkane dehalogenase
MPNSSATDNQPTAANLWRALYPFRSNFKQIGGHAYHYVDEGPSDVGEGSQPTLLFSHGNPTWSFHFRALLGALRGSFRVVAPDHLGCGLSDKPNTMFRLTDRIDHLVTLIETLDLHDITLVAQDWGGAIGLGAALRLPERFNRFVLLNTGAFRPWFFPWRIRICRIPVLGRIGVQGANLFARAALRMTMVHPEKLTPAIRAGCLAPYDSWRNRTAIYHFVEDIPWSPAHPTHATLEKIEAGLPSLANRPTKLIWGMRDWCFTPACLEKFQSIFPNAEVHRLENAGHWVLEDAPEQVVALIQEFVERGVANQSGRQ